MDFDCLIFFNVYWESFSTSIGPGQCCFRNKYFSGAAVAAEYIMLYFVKNPFWLKNFLPGCVWSIEEREKNIYLTFDDGPHSQQTEFVLDELKKYGAKASFFCIGKNVELYPEIFQKIKDEGHAVGNHTWSHADGWRTSRKKYFDDVMKARQNIDSNLFRPPYGRITPWQVKKLKRSSGMKTIMWSIISGDFDQNISPQQCLKNVAENIFPGAIIVFHDSSKAALNMRYALPAVLDEFSAKGYRFMSLGAGQQF